MVFKLPFTVTVIACYSSCLNCMHQFNFQLITRVPDSCVVNRGLVATTHKIEIIIVFFHTDNLLSAACIIIIDIQIQ